MNSTIETTLYSYASNYLMTLEAAIAIGRESLEGAIALLYSPQTCQIAILKNSQLTNSSGSRILGIQDVFEARIFNSNCELRWLNQTNGNGKTVFLSESQLSLEAFTEKNQKCEPLSQQYIVWGEKAKNQPKAEGWQRLAEARIGKLDIPCEQTLEKHQRIYLKTKEYLAAEDQCGNYAVIEERLLNMEVA
ncbi:CRISPR-associated protein Csx19 [[Limnothrix rosea] IAM M-220]|uniref:type III-D CRISPR-associated protein Csx19 n=1 Tax=[Limnothrix rosea] IAM M-220 TaxID=454133 RepID=UPI0009627889|nr:CRISPR-associated protein Csx19 [[Limnothrix rosea] IAM M-220]OKH18642.1 CRISPR-associated protein [[Limnothrix rosea] IAM M-220]